MTEKWSYSYNTDSEMRTKLEDIQHANRLRTFKETIDFAINQTHKEMIECIKSKNSTNN